MGYARADDPLTDAAVLGAQYRIDIAGDLFAVRTDDEVRFRSDGSPPPASKRAAACPGRSRR
jgi:hypothetical protein